MKDRRYIISGAGSGIGRAIAIKLASEGAGIILAGRNLEKLEEYKEALKYQILAKNVISNISGSNSNLEKKYIYRIQSTINISNIYEKTSQYEKVINELKLILSPDLKEKWLQGYVIVMGNLGYSKMKKGLINGTDEYFKEAFKISIKNNFENNKIYQLKNFHRFCQLSSNQHRFRLLFRLIHWVHLKKQD